MKTNKPKSLYIHIPFCQHLCFYCDFCKMNYIESIADSYLIALERELDNYEIGDLETIYVGGGTPTSFNYQQLEKLLRMISKYYRNGIEYTFESNVETLDEEKIKLLKKYHVNRLSIGVESTDDKILKSINRHHNFDDVKKTLALLRDYGFNNINLDLILGLPNSDIEQTKKDVLNLINLNPEHISTYSLLVNPNTIFYIKNIKELNQDKQRALYDVVDNYLCKAGYVHYEVSNFARENYYSKHNLVYWQDQQYYGVGLGASGYIGDKRYTNTKSINKYLKGEYISTCEKVSKKDDLIYYLMLKLRTIDGIDLNEFKVKFNEDLIKKCRESINKYINANLLNLKKEKLIPTYEGMMVLDQIVIDLLNEFDLNN